MQLSVALHQLLHWLGSRGREEDRGRSEGEEASGGDVEGNAALRGKECRISAYQN